MPIAPALRIAALVALTLTLGACEDVDSPMRVAERGSAAWSVAWIIAGLLVGATLAAGFVKLRLELARKAAARGAASRPTSRAVAVPRRWLAVLFCGVLLFVGVLVATVGAFLSRPLSWVELLVAAVIMAVGAVLMRVAGRAITTSTAPPTHGDAGRP